jgi:hypothetical protein
MTEQELADLFAKQPEPQAVFFRLYHDEHGFPLFYSMQDVSGTYIEISQEDYTRSAGNVRVRDGRIVQVNWQLGSKVTPGAAGTKCHPLDVAVVVNQDPGVYWSKRTYESS